MDYETASVTVGHGIYQPSAHAPDDDASWLTPYVYAGQARRLREHIQRGVEIAAETGGLWIPSGADTNPATDLSEADSMIAVAHECGWWDHPEVAGSTRAERHARDSMGNIALADAVFLVKTGRRPRRLFVTGFKFKEKRFLQHAQDLGLTQRTEVIYIGVNDPPEDMLRQSRQGERKKYLALKHDPYLRSEEFRVQRANRNPRRLPIPALDAEVDDLIAFLYAGDLFPAPRQR
jgi:hypothetical protein